MRAFVHRSYDACVRSSVVRCVRSSIGRTTRAFVHRSYDACVRPSVVRRECSSIGRTIRVFVHRSYDACVRSSVVRCVRACVRPSVVRFVCSSIGRTMRAFVHRSYDACVRSSVVRFRASMIFCHKTIVSRSMFACQTSTSVRHLRASTAGPASTGRTVSGATALTVALVRSVILKLVGRHNVFLLPCPAIKQYSNPPRLPANSN